MREYDAFQERVGGRSYCVLQVLEVLSRPQASGLERPSSANTSLSVCTNVLVQRYAIPGQNRTTLVTVPSRGCTVDKGRARHFILALNSSVAMDGHRRGAKVLAESPMSIVLRGSVLRTEGANAKSKREVLRHSFKKLLSKLKARNFIIWVKR